ncbi:MAG: 50S ribosomal protein L7/L12 [Candidatus Pacebacteria bacterium]|nr:50S ribosomal protein L7/L12 [Candidatus Paceibacterota bacterium]NUQ57226.1 50S ribosomal protein L7/L12 [Candidatus Paceibacter sp.]
MEIPSKFKDIVEKIESMSVMDLSELVKLLEEKFGVSAQAVAMMAPVAGGAAAGGAEEKSSFNIELKEAGAQKIQVIKVLREALGLGLKEAKDFTDKTPVVVKEGVDKKAADELKAKLEAAGAVVNLK